LSTAIAKKADKVCEVEIVRVKRGLFNPTLIAIISFCILVSVPKPAYAMHIMEGFLPVEWAVFWWVVALPFFILGLRSLTRTTQANPQLKLLLGLAGAFAFVLSALKIPSVTGSSSHPTGTGLGAVLFGPLTMSVLGSLVLLFQSLLLAHGGLTTLGANAFSMAIAGPFAAYWIYNLTIKISGKEKIAIFLSAAIANLLTYIITSIQLALAFPAPVGGFMASFIKFTGIFAITQVPLAISEGLLTLLVWNWLQSYNPQELELLQLIKGGKGNESVSEKIN
jgi:cobalt/nickel transport system permease protein